MTKEQYKQLSSRIRRQYREEWPYGWLDDTAQKRVMYFEGVDDGYWAKVDANGGIPAYRYSTRLFMTFNEECNYLRFIPPENRPRTFFLKGGRIMVQENVGDDDYPHNPDIEEKRKLEEIGFTDLGHNMHEMKVFDWEVVNFHTEMAERILRRRRIDDVRS